MQKKLLKIGKNIFPNNLKINKKLNIGIVGSGKMAKNYMEVVNSFNHNVLAIISLSKNPKAKKLARKYNADLYHNYRDVKKIKKKIDAWIICSRWEQLSLALKSFINLNKPLLVEKSITMSSYSLTKFLKKNKINKSKIFFAYNRNYYDYIFSLIREIKKNNSLKYIDARFYDPYSKIVKLKGGSIKKYLPYYITSHWVVLILKILNLLNVKIINIEKKKLFTNSQFNAVMLLFKLEIKKRVIFLKFTNIPDAPKNHTIDFYMKSGHIQISPIEKLTIVKNLKVKNINSQNIYVPNDRFLKVNSKFKPGLRYLYYSFIKESFFKEKSLLKTSYDDLVSAYKICELLN